MANSGMDYPEIQERIEKQLTKEKRFMQFFFFVFSLGLYIVLITVGWSLFLSNGGQIPSGNWPGIAKAANPIGDAMMMLTVAGFIPLLFQFINLILSTRIGERQLRDRVTGRIMQAEMKKQYDALEAAKNKPKRTMRLTDDGEIEEVTEDIEQHARESRDRAL